MEKEEAIQIFTKWCQDPGTFENRWTQFVQSPNDSVFTSFSVPVVKVIVEQTYNNKKNFEINWQTAPGSLNWRGCDISKEEFDNLKKIFYSGFPNNTAGS